MYCICSWCKKYSCNLKKILCFEIRVPLHIDYWCHYKIWLTSICGHVYQKCPVVHLLLRWITNYPCKGSICAYIYVCTTILIFPQAVRLQWLFFQSQQQAVYPTVIFASDAVESILTLVPARVCMFSHSWSFWLAMFESVLHRGLGVYGEAWRARANVCSCDYKCAGWAQGDCFPSVPVCSYDVEWHLFLRSVPRLSRGESLMQVLEGWGHFSSPAILSCLQLSAVGFSCCCSFPEQPGVIMGRPLFSNEMTKQVHRLKLCSWESHSDQPHWPLPSDIMPARKIHGCITWRFHWRSSCFSHWSTALKNNKTKKKKQNKTYLLMYNYT